MQHLMSKSPEYKVWSSMKNRCTNEKAEKYRIYGGRGISVCARWLESFSAFYEDMGGRPTGKHSIDRIDNSGGYEPDNCRWSTAKEQRANQRPYPNNYNASLIDPLGVRHVIKAGGLNEFCSKMRITLSKVSCVLRGIDRQHKGWTGRYLR